ncbi:MAG: heparinase II/III family protein, partial [Myxococcales bacterium]|nr:heparinase II/III family protein [Myxococcales bacterium]
MLRSVRAIVTLSLSFGTLALGGLAACGDDGGAGTVTDALGDTAAAVDTLPADTVDDAVDDTATADVVDPDTAADAVDAEPDVDSQAADADTADLVDTAPVLDPNGDTDKDGVFDLDEVDDGTDPFDPRSCRAWHPEIAGHPRLFLRPDDVAAVAARVGAEGAPAHAAIWPRIVSRANQAPPEQPTDGTYDPSVAAAQGDIAEAAAFRGLLEGDAAMTAKAVALLAAAFPDPTYLNQQSAFDVGAHYDLIESEALVGFCTAYDYVAGTPGVAAEDLAAARAGVVARIDTFRRMCFQPGGCRALIVNERNNHTEKPVGALGLCAIAVPDRPEAAADFNDAVASLDWLLNVRQGVPEGGYAEGWNYLVYAGQSFLQLMLAWHRLAPGAEWPLHGLGAVTPSDPRAGDIATYRDFATHPTTRAIFKNLLVATTPNARTVPTDDGNPSTWPGGLLAALFDDPHLLWRWDATGYATPRCATATFAALDPAMTAADPDWPLETFLPEAGFSVLRSDFGPDALYLHVNHERGVVREAGFSHEHADNLSLVLHAFGEPLVIDPGYIDYTNHKKVRYATDHNLVLVDGAGPDFSPFDDLVQAQPNCDAFLHDHDVDATFATLIASSKYAGAEVRRRVVRVANRWVIVADSLLSATPRTWTWQLNG